jgi:hypothetical protein
VVQNPIDIVGKHTCKRVQHVEREMNETSDGNVSNETQGEIASIDRRGTNSIERYPMMRYKTHLEARGLLPKLRPNHGLWLSRHEPGVGFFRCDRG